MLLENKIIWFDFYGNNYLTSFEMLSSLSIANIILFIFFIINFIKKISILITL